MASKELRELTDADLRNELKETQAQQQQLRFDHAVKGLENNQVLKDIRRDIARMHTELRRRELEGMSEADLAKRSRIRARRAAAKKRK